MTQKVKELNNFRSERETDLRRALTDPSCGKEARADAIQAYRRAKADALGAAQARREELELQIFQQIELWVPTS